MRYDKGNFAVVPNLRLMSNLSGNEMKVFVAVCSYADNNGECFPSRRALKDITGISEKAITTAISNLEEKGWLVRENRKREDGSTTSNMYTIQLFAPIERGTGAGYQVGMETPSPKRSTPPPQKIGRALPKNQGDINIPVNIPSKDKQLTSLATQALRDETNLVIELFKQVNPSYDQLFRNKTQRAAASRLLAKFGMPSMVKMLSTVEKTNGMPYAPVITTPVELERNGGRLKAFLTKHQTEKAVTRNITVSV